jgi:hypothetical protein
MSVGSTTRSKNVDPFTRGDLESWGGIVSGTVQDYAEAIGVHPDQVLDASERVPLLVDTAEHKGRGKDYDRSEDPKKRCLGLTTEHAETLADLAQEM